MRLIFLRLLLFYWLIPWLPVAGDDFSDNIDMFDKNEPRSRLMMVNGNMYFHAGYNKNITFVAPGAGSIWIGKVDISNLPTLTQVDDLADKIDSTSTMTLQTKNRLEGLSKSVIAVANISKTIIAVTRNISLDVKMLREWKKDKIIKDLRLRKFLNKISKGIKLLVDAFKASPCDSKPCQGGATCIPRFGKNYFCLCPPHQTGERCEADLDECATYVGALACQNNATCENIANGFLCHCPKGFHGPLCQYQQTSCRRTPGLCGHGHCIEAVEEDAADYRCICDPGYKLSPDKENPTCIDINECEKNPCHPGVDCINLPGSFQCSGCPKGFFGNGIQCADVDECSLPDYPCSVNPRAPCINTVGGYHCGACPPGYRGDGKTCKRFSACAHRPCYPSANCTDDIDNINAGGFTCQCPEGYLGDGIGPNGCRKGNSTICRADGRCINGGSCQPVTEDSYLCICPEGYLGSRCEKVSECLYSPCKNGGTCQYDVTNGYSCLCPNKFYGHDCESEEDSCGQHFTDREGNFTYPDSFFDATTEAKLCDFVISPSANNEALRIWFTQFNGMENIAGGPINCKTAYGNVSLFDGDSDNANLLGLFCGSQTSPKAPWINTPITMTGSRAMLRYKGTKGVWGVKWELKKRDCGYRTSVPSGSLTVPVHYQNISCEWFISAPADQVVELKIPSVKLGTIERNCSVNQIEVYDGYAAYDSHRIIHFCETLNETVTVRSTGPFLSVFFTNDLLWSSITTLPGFHMSYKFVEPDHKCGGEIINVNKDFSFSGEITSPNWGGLYPPDMHCIWKIDGINNDNLTASAMQSLRLEFLDFDVPSPFMFNFDRTIPLSFGSPFKLGYDSSIPLSAFLRLRGRRPLLRSLIKCTEDYVFADGNLVHDGCNSHRPPPSLLISEGRAIVQFRSDSKTQGKGFRMKYSLVCEKNLRGNGTIQTWNYPDGGVKGKCKYTIVGNPSDAIILKVKYIGLRTASVRDCFFAREVSSTVEDYVKLTGGREENKFLNQKYVCPKFPFVEDGEFTVSASRPLIIEYSSSGNPKNKGILLEYQTVDVGCGGIYNQNTGTISSPSYPNRYLPHMHCTYHISVMWSKRVRLTFDNFDLEVVQNDDCSYDRVEVYDKYIDEANHGNLLGKFCGSMIPPAILSPSFDMVVVFISDRSIAGAGFSARFDYVDTTTYCDRTFTAPSGNIVFNASMGRFTECNYHIALPFNSKIILKVENMNLPCNKGRLQIRNGADVNSPGFASLWGESEVCNEHPLQTQLRTHGNRAYIKLILVDSKGVSFNISYEQITSNCGGHISGVSGSIAPPQYPQKDSRPMECGWIIAVAPGNRVSFQLALIDDLHSADENGFCGIFAANRLDVMDGPQLDSNILRRYCRKLVAADPVESTHNELSVKYKQQGGIQFGALYGFLAHFTTNCRDIELTGFSGTIQSPGYPDPVYTNRFCTWTIRVPQGNRIKITFHTFIMDQITVYGYKKYDGCANNWLKFNPDEVGQAYVRYSHGITNQTNSLSETCDKVKPSSVTSTGNVLHLTMQSKQKEQNKFWLTWTTIGCGGDLLAPSNITINANNFAVNFSIIECFWKISAPIGKKIKITVDKFLIFKNGAASPMSRDCQWDEPGFTGLETFAGLNNESGVVQDKFCNAVKESPQIFLSHSNQMFLRLKVMDQSIQTEKDGSFFSAYVEFIETNPGDQDDCGGVIEVPINENRTIHSPRFPNEYPKDAHCQWLFKAPPGHHLNFYLKEFTTPNAHPQHEVVIPRTSTYSVENVTCDHPLYLREGFLGIYEGNSTTKSKLVERLCQDTQEVRSVEVDSPESLVVFQGASAHRLHMSGEEEKKRIGFVLEASASCGSLEFADSEESAMKFFDLPKGFCNVTIRKRNSEDSGIVVRLDEYHLHNKISKYHQPNQPRDYFSDEIYITIDGGEPIRRSIDMQALRALRNPYTHEEFRGENEIKFSIVRRTSLLAVQVALTYHTNTQNCGTTLVGKNGFVAAPKLTEDMECIWLLDNNPGNKVIFTVVSLTLPQSDNCVESYVEVRRFNDSGPLIERFCVDGPKTFTDQALWIKLRFIKPVQLNIDTDLDDLIDENLNAPAEYGLKFRYQQMGGNTLTTPGTIMQPKVHFGTSLEYKIMGEEGKGLVFHMDKANFPEYTFPRSNETDPQKWAATTYLPAGLYFVDYTVSFFSIVAKMREMIITGSKNVITGWHPPKIYIPNNEVIIYAVGMHDNHYTYSLRWRSVEIDDIPNPNTTVKPEQKYDCGGILTPSWEWQSIRSPPAGTPAYPQTYNDAGYPPDTHCMWEMTRPKLTGIEIKIVTMDLEDIHNCIFDYVALIAIDNHDINTEEALESAHKLCRNSQTSESYRYTYNKKVNIHFVSDRNRGGTGFEIQYRLMCNSFDFIRREQGIYSGVLTSPGYPNEAKEDVCSWTLILESNRRISVTINDINVGEEDCDQAYLSMVEQGSMAAFYNPNKPKFCGRPGEAKNATMKHGRLYIKWIDKEKKHPKGFKIKIEEITEECTFDELLVDEAVPTRTFRTPHYPELIPHSLDCNYILRAPAGRRLQFTVDPKDFRLDSHPESDSCICDSCDYLEIRDGPTEQSPLIGRYCSTRPPSTITSTSNFLFVKLKTDSYSQSSGFKAEIRMAVCGGTISLVPNKTHLLHSPNYPDVYPVQGECIWTVYSPNSHFVESTLNHVWVSWSINCTSDHLNIYDGNLSAPLLIPSICSPQRIESLDQRSSSSMMTVQFIANSTLPKTSKAFCKDRKCGFEIALKVSKNGCGGLIEDNQGVLTTPGYPGRLLPHVQCRWDLRAAPGYRYLLEFEFTDPSRNGFYQQRYTMSGTPRSRGCFMDLLFFNGKFDIGKPQILGQHYFCENETTYVTEADYASIIYSDLSTQDAFRINNNAVEDQYYVPFRIHYTRVPTYFDEFGCTYKIDTNTTMNMGKFRNTSSYAADARMKKPEGYSTTVIKIQNYTDLQNAFPRGCSDWASFIEFESDENEIRAVKERFCNATFTGIKSGGITRVYNNKRIDVHIKTIISAWQTVINQKDNNFHLACGGIIDDPNSGVVTSPGYGMGNYLPNQNCLWQLRAPEGMVVWINITNFEVEQHIECEKDALIAGEGKDNLIIHRYCQPDQLTNETFLSPLAPRHRSFRTHSRYLTLTWQTDDKVEFSGWRIEYEFVDVGDGCGFTTHAMTGVVHSPKFPRDYPNDEECIWDIQVPIGYHVVLKFTHFDIEASPECINDFLQISEEHNSRSNEPLGEYYYLFEDEEKKAPMCGIVTPSPVETTSNRMRLNFTTNSKINAKGFRAEWSAACGAVYRLSHYEIVSPHYPQYYPNEDQECLYMIRPEGELEKAIVVLKIKDLDLSPIRIQFGRYPCESDYLEILDLMNDRILQTFCGGEEFSEEPIAIRGPVGIRMFTNQSFMHEGTKRHRGFSVTYSMKACGGTVNMMTDEEFIYPISSPAFPLEYPHDLDCVWNFTTTGDRIFAIRFLKMELEETPQCDLDFLEIYDGTEMVNTTRMGTWCGDPKNMPKNLLKTQKNSMIVRFVTDSSMSRGGFKIVVTATLGPKHGCGGKLEAIADWNELRPPLKSDGSYHSNLYCGWTITGPEKSMIEFKLEMMDTEELQPLPGDPPKDSCVDELKIYDGYRAFSPLLVDNLCYETAGRLPKFFHSSHRVAHVSFESDSSGNGRGFSMLYRAISPDCGQWIAATEAVERITYDSKLRKEAREGQDSQRCQWVITSNEQVPIELNFRKINFASPDGDCSDAFIELRDVGTVAKCQHPACATHENEKKILRYCGEVPHATFISNTMAVQITTSAYLINNGTSSFILDYQLLSNCNRTINGTELQAGRITSPNYPNPYNHNDTCTTTIVAASGYQILLVFKEFRLEMGRPVFYAHPNNTLRPASLSRLTYRIPRCDHDWVQVFEGKASNNTKSYCGTGLPPTILSSGRNLSILMQTDYSVNSEGYDAYYYTGTYNAGKRTYLFSPIYDHSGAITSVGYPNGYNDSTIQRFSVHPPSGQACVFEIETASLALGPQDASCQDQEEYLHIEHKDSDGSDFPSQKIRKCSHTTPIKFNVEPGENRRIRFIFVSDAKASNNGIGFRLNWNCHLPSSLT